MTRRTLLLALAMGIAIPAAGCGAKRRAEPWASGPVDINTAGEGELQRLPGVTPSMARRIYEGRPYRTLDELIERGLLSERELERVRRKVTVSRPEG